MAKQSKPQHINASKEDLSGNNGLGAYIFMTGSDQRAFQISEHFSNVRIKKHERQHNLYIGDLAFDKGTALVASISSGMGGPSADIIINELLALGIRRILRVGTAGSLQPDRIKVGDLVIASAAVRDDKASWDYIYREYPAIASLEYLVAAHRAWHSLKLKQCHTGIVHSKSSLYARELKLSSLKENEDYMESLNRAGVLASEMECAQLFILASLMTAKDPKNPILVGAILGIIGDETAFSEEKTRIQQVINSAIELSLETTKEIILIDKGLANSV